ncbi:hypothetical protein BTO20_31345 [Mycobacterium dioxanotrophicus]|uniref:Polysaccharide chain length determinant N-terminal domain-containing protein n=1 Tax=Mycobacterium dioxanotrophicus TaxID=482462 RepID=A0A1Y0CB20_9MYCO|nr:hypothetical protein [Mycobacterium dioxanotrophicus]ART72458.1 hypothetical protein BTO20_31345 [Mycobacterium dioxanotrophicus]
MHPAAYSRHRRIANQDVGAGVTTALPVAKVDSPAEAEGTKEIADRSNMTLFASNLKLIALLVSVVIIGAGTGYIGALVLPKQFAARAQLQYNLSNSVPNELLREDRTLTTQLVLLDSRAVLAPIASANGMTPEDFARNVSAEILDSSEIIQVEVRDRNAARAQMLLTRVIDGYLALANKSWRDPVRSYQESQIRSLQSQLDDVHKQLQVTAASGQDGTALVQRQEVLQTELDSLHAQLSSGPVSATEPPARVVTAPYQVADQVRPRPLLAAAAGAAAAVVVAGFVVLIVARRRARS